MALSQKLELRQGQALVMTPQLMQAIKLLQLSHLDLAAYVDAELERNPLLERAEPDRSEDPIADAGNGTETVGAEEGERGEEWLGDSPETSRSAIEDKLDTGLENVFPEGTATSEGRATPRDTPGYSEWAGVGAGGREGGDYNLEAFVSAEVTLADHLARQLTLAVEDPVQRIIGQYLIDLVDEAGYLRGDVASIAEKLGASASEVAAILDILQTFDPPGVCARDLAECLALQLKERDRYDPAIAALVANLDLLAKRDFAGLKRVCGIDEEDLVDMVGEIRRLNPKPGLAFGGGGGGARRAG